MTLKNTLPLGSMELPVLSPQAAQDFVADMLVELCIISENANLSDLAGLLQVTVKSVELHNRPIM